MNPEKYQKFSLPDELEIRSGPGALPFIYIQNRAATAVISLLGAHVLSYIPAGADDLLWVSRLANYAEGQAIRGGIPVCWPWFGATPDNIPFKTLHGFVRFILWDLESSCRCSADCTELTLSFSDSPLSKAIWPYAFKLSLQIRVGKSLQLELTTLNRDQQPFVINQALHSYFKVGDIRQVEVAGFDACPYIDTIPGGPLGRPLQKGNISFDSETDAVFPDCPEECHIVDASLKRKIKITRGNSCSSVVWNPWIDKAKRMPDFGDEEYLNMLCVESCNIRDDAREIAPGKQHNLKTTLQLVDNE